MIEILIKHIISEICIEMTFDKISSNFNRIPIIYNKVSDFYVGQKFITIEVIAQHRTIDGASVISVNTIDEYINVLDNDGFTFRIDVHDIPRLRFIK